MSKKLTRKLNDKMVSGVASGLAEYFQLEVTWVRIAFVLATFFGGGGLWIYIILWIAVPESNGSVIYEQTFSNPEPIKTTKKPRKEKVNGNLIGGLVLISLGSYFLLDEFDIIPDWFNIGKLWPLIFVFIGVSILSKGAKKEAEIRDFDPKDFKPEEPTQYQEVVNSEDNQQGNKNI